MEVNFRCDRVPRKFGLCALVVNKRFSPSVANTWRRIYANLLARPTLWRGKIAEATRHHTASFLVDHSTTIYLGLWPESVIERFDNSGAVSQSRCVNGDLVQSRFARRRASGYQERSNSDS